MICSVQVLIKLVLVEVHYRVVVFFAGCIFSISQSNSRVLGFSSRFSFKFSLDFLFFDQPGSAGAVTTGRINDDLKKKKPRELIWKERYTLALSRRNTPPHIQVMRQPCLQVQKKKPQSNSAHLFSASPTEMTLQPP